MEKRRSFGIRIVENILITYGVIFFLHFLLQLGLVVKGIIGISSISAPRNNFHNSLAFLTYGYPFPVIFVYFCFFIYYLQNLLVPIGYLFGGVALKLKSWGRKFVLGIIGIDIVAKLITLCILPLKVRVYPTNLSEFFLSTQWRALLFCLRFIFGIFAIYYLTRPKVKEQFK